MNKLRLIFLVFLCIFVAIIVKLFIIQFVTAGSYGADYTSITKLAAVRGRILDIHGDPIVVNETRYHAFIEPQHILDRDKLIKELATRLHMDEASVAARIQPDKKWVSVKRDIPEETKTVLEGMHIPGLGFDEETHRVYPEASLAAHLVGFVGKNDRGEDTGYFGIEGFYDQDLAGLPGVMRSERDIFNKPIFFGSQQRMGAENGRDLILTIDKNVQHIVKSELKKGIDRFKAQSGCVITVDPSTMAILALVCLPDFDAESYYDYTEQDFKNWTISSVYEPGSTFKPLVMAAAIEEHAVKPDEIFDEDGPVSIGEYTIRNWNDKYSGPISMTRILEKSSNVGMVHVAAKLGKKKLAAAIDKYGFGEPSGIDLQGEVGGVVKPLDSWYDIDASTFAFGQGISVTAMQLIRGFAAVINGGYLMRPYVVAGVIENGERRMREPVIQRRVLSDKTSRIMRTMLISTINHAEAKWDMPKGYTFGGKTGTAQIPISGHYDSTKTIASFIGFVPANHPKFLTLVVINQPESSSWGSETAAPLFFDIARDLLIYYNIPRE